MCEGPTSTHWTEDEGARKSGHSWWQTKADSREHEGQGLEREVQLGRSQNDAEMYLLNSKHSRRPWRKFW